MSKLIDLTGQKFGKLTVVEFAGYVKNGRSKWRCICECGNEVVVEGAALRRGHTKSCGCYRRECVIKLKTTHGGCGTRLYRIWQNIKNRCYYENNIEYKNYGGRGISMCESWKDCFESFKDWSLENGYSDELSIDRINVDGNYEPSNCRWATREQQANNKTNNHLLTYKGKTQTMTKWAEELGFSYYVIRTRIRLGWTAEETLSTPVGQPKNKSESV